MFMGLWHGWGDVWRDVWGMFMGMIVPMLHRSPNVWVRQRHGHSYGKLPCNLGPEVNTLRRVMSARGEALVLSCLASFYPDY